MGTPSSWALSWKHFHTLNSSLSLCCPHVINIHSALITALTSISFSTFSPPLAYFRLLGFFIWSTGKVSKLSLFFSPSHSVLYVIPESSNVPRKLSVTAYYKGKSKPLFWSFILSNYLLKSNNMHPAFQHTNWAPWAPPELCKNSQTRSIFICFTLLKWD